MRLVGYPRVSTRGQVKTGASIPYQDREIRAWARGNGHRIVGMFPEEGRSGALDLEDRAALTAAIDLIATGKAEGLVCYSLDRLAREITVQEAILAKVWEEAGGQVFTTDQGEVLNGPERTTTDNSTATLTCPLKHPQVAALPDLALGAGNRLLEVCISLAVPGRPIRSLVAEDQSAGGVRDQTAHEPAGTRWVHAEPAGKGLQRARAVTTEAKEPQVRPPAQPRPGNASRGGPEFESPPPRCGSDST